MQNIKFAICSDLIKEKNLETLEAHLNYQPGCRKRRNCKSKTTKMNFSAKSGKLLNIFLLFFFSKKKVFNFFLSTCLLAASFCGLEVFVFSLPSPSQHTHAGSEKTFSTIFVTFMFGLRSVAMFESVQRLS